MGLSAGLDFEAKLFAKPDASRARTRQAGYKPRTIAISTNTDPYQPIEREWRIMRQILEVLDRANHPVTVVTKSALILRDLDILSAMAARGIAEVAISVTTLDRKLTCDGAAGLDADQAAGGHQGLERGRGFKPV